MVRIVVDTAADFYLEELEGRNILRVPITVTLNGTDYIEGVNMQRNDFYCMLVNSKEFPKTSQPSPQAFLDIFLKAKEAGDTVICILLSSQLSGTYHSAQLAKAMAEYEKIHLIDSLTAACPIRILAEHACRLAEEGMPAEEIVAEIEALKSHVKVLAAVDTLEYLYKGGRLGKASAAIGTVARIKPLISISEEGTVSVVGKALGKSKAAAGILSRLEEMQPDSRFPLYSIYTYGTENCEKLEQKLKEKKYVIAERVQVGSTIGAHVGPGAFGVVFVTR